jgi:hypothetical protein
MSESLRTMSLFHKPMLEETADPSGAEARILIGSGRRG